MKIPFIDLASQFNKIEKGINHNIQKVLSHGQYIMGPEVEELEKKLGEYCETKHCITVASGTEALLISLMALGVKADDEVITTPFTFISTVEVICLLGAKPIFVDVDPITCNINPNLIKSKITKKTKVIMPVSLYGQPPDMDEINDIALENNITVIEDAAQSFGATYKGKLSCNLSKIGCTSFFPSKPLGCYGDGGAIFVSDDIIAEICRKIRVHGQSEKYVHTQIGVGGRMDTLQCAILLEKLKIFPQEIILRNKVASNYNDLLDINGIERVKIKNDRNCTYAQYTIFVKKRNEIQNFLKNKGVPTAVHYPVPVHRQPAYKDFCCPDCLPNADELSQKVLSLPMSPYLTKKDQNYIIEMLSKAIIAVKE